MSMDLSLEALNSRWGGGLINSVGYYTVIWVLPYIIWIIIWIFIWIIWIVLIIIIINISIIINIVINIINITAVSTYIFTILVRAPFRTIRIALYLCHRDIQTISGSFEAQGYRCLRQCWRFGLGVDVLFVDVVLFPSFVIIYSNRWILCNNYSFHFNAYLSNSIRLGDSGDTRKRWEGRFFVIVIIIIFIWIIGVFREWEYARCHSFYSL